MDEYFHEHICMVLVPSIAVADEVEAVEVEDELQVPHEQLLREVQTQQETFLSEAS
jgi:hypothetical protein